MYILAYVFVAATICIAEASRDEVAADSSEVGCDGTSISFEKFVELHKRPYIIGSKEFDERRARFQQQVAASRVQNCKPGKRLWIAGINMLSDRTQDELARLRGRKGGMSPESQPSGSGPGPRDLLVTLESQEGSVRQRGSSLRGGTQKLRMPKNFDWGSTGKNLQSLQPEEIIDQGGCGSCWASATVGTLNAHTDIYSEHKNFSIQQLVSCVPNPQECGGKGGCDGSTGELALDYVMHNGLGTTQEFPYSQSDESCPAALIAKDKYPTPQPMSSFLEVAGSGDVSDVSSPARQFGMIGWSRLPVNKAAPLFKALYTEGPVAVSVVAGPSWNLYLSGVMDDCSLHDMVVNHLVVLIGYGEDPVNGKFWKIQNSWGAGWGEEGTVRMIRRDNEESFCDWDESPLIGTGCKGGPSKVWVCGSCGILYDNVVPHFHGSTSLAQEMLQRRSEGLRAPE